jgi:hypothetical protein
VAVRQQDVLRLDVPMDDPPPVSVVECLGDLGGDAQRVGERESRLALEACSE